MQQKTETKITGNFLEIQVFVYDYVRTIVHMSEKRPFMGTFKYFMVAMAAREKLLSGKLLLHDRACKNTQTRHV